MGANSAQLSSRSGGGGGRYPQTTRQVKMINCYTRADTCGLLVGLCVEGRELAKSRAPMELVGRSLVHSFGRCRRWRMIHCQLRPMVGLAASVVSAPAPAPSWFGARKAANWRGNEISAQFARPPSSGNKWPANECASLVGSNSPLCQLSAWSARGPPSARTTQRAP